MVSSVEKAEEGQAAKKDRVYIEAVARAFRLLEGFALTPEPQTLSQLAAAADIDKSAAQRMAHTLVQLGYLQQVSNGFVPGNRLLERSFDYLRTNPLISRAIPILTDLRKSVNERVDLSIYDDLTMLYVVRLQSKRDTFFAHLIGRRVPTFCTSGGRAVMSALRDDEVLGILNRSDRRKLTAKTVTDIDEIVTAVHRTRDAGYSLASEQVQIGELAIGVALVDKQKRPVGAIHVAASLGEWEPQEFERRVAPLAVAAAIALNA